MEWRALAWVSEEASVLVEVSGGVERPVLFPSDAQGFPGSEQQGPDPSVSHSHHFLLLACSFSLIPFPTSTLLSV